VFTILIAAREQGLKIKIIKIKICPKNLLKKYRRCYE
jgi:hypothetical protein